MQCPNCYAEVDDDTTVCSVCGADLTGGVTENDSGFSLDSLSSALDTANKYRKTGADTASAIATLANTVGSLIPGAKQVASQVASVASGVGSTLGGTAKAAKEASEAEKTASVTPFSFSVDSAHIRTADCPGQYPAGT